MTLARARFVRVVCWLVMPATVFACPICFGADDPSTSAGVRAAVFTLMGVTMAVIGVMAVFVRGFVRRSQAAAAQGSAT